MMKNVGAQVPDEQLPILVKYLAENFPEKPRPLAPVIAGPTHVVFKEWVLPTPGSRPHDPLASLDGRIWYTGQMANVLGRVDPTSGRIAEYHLDTPMSGPHGLVADRDGNIWFTALQNPCFMPSHRHSAAGTFFPAFILAKPSRTRHIVLDFKPDL
jgi:virginiamycin B lyase